MAMSTSEAGRKGAQSQPTEAKRKGGRRGAKAQPIEAKRRGGQHSHQND